MSDNLNNNNFKNWISETVDSLTGRASTNIANKNLEYQKSYNDLIMTREDNAFQRQVNDLKKAGLSANLIAGNGASAGGSMQVPHIEDVSNKKVENLYGMMNLANAFANTMTNIANVNSIVQRNDFEIGQLPAGQNKPYTIIGKFFTDMRNLFPDVANKVVTDANEAVNDAVGTDKTNNSNIFTDIRDSIQSLIDNKKAKAEERRKLREQKKLEKQKAKETVVAEVTKNNDISSMPIIDSGKNVVVEKPKYSTKPVQGMPIELKTSEIVKTEPKKEEYMTIKNDIPKGAKNITTPREYVAGIDPSVNRNLDLTKFSLAMYLGLEKKQIRFSDIDYFYDDILGKKHAMLLDGKIADIRY